jgi:hypothetical protein
MAIQSKENLIDDDFADEILKEALEGYGDLIAAARVHNVCVKSLQNRVNELRVERVSWIL